MLTILPPAETPRLPPGTGGRIWPIQVSPISCRNCGRISATGWGSTSGRIADGAPMQQSFRAGRIGAVVVAMALRAAAADSAVIVNSGSTNTAGFRIVVERSGDAENTVTRRRPGPDGSEQPTPASRHVSAPLGNRLF